MNENILKVVYCSGCGTGYKVSGDHRKKNSPCCGKPLTVNQDAVFAFQAKLEISVTKLLNGEK